MFKTLSLLICASFLLLFSLPSPAQTAKGAIEVDGRIVLGAYQGMVEEHLFGILHGLSALAATQDVVSGDWERVKGPLAAFKRDAPTATAMWFARPDGSYFTVEGGRARQSLEDRDYFPVLMSGKAVAGSLVISKSTGERSVIVAAPITKDGKVVGALGASLSVEALAKLVESRAGLPKDLIFYALDAQGRTALHRDSSLIFQFPSDIGDQSLKAAVQTMLSAPEGVVNYTFRGSHRTAIFVKSEATGWVFVLGKVPAG